MADKNQIALGLDFGTESVRALLIDLAGCEQASAIAPYEHGQITKTSYPEQVKNFLQILHSSTLKIGSIVPRSQCAR